MKTSLLFCALWMLAIPTHAFADSPAPEKFDALKNATILVIRHAEKPESGSGLSADGEVRANAYVNYFKNLTVNGQPVKLDYLFAAADSKKSHRSRLTIEPTGKALGLDVDSRFKDKDFLGLVEEVHSKPHGKAILIAWHHENIPALIGALGAKPGEVIPNEKWPADVFGWLILLRYDDNGQLMEVKRINENLLPSDSIKRALDNTLTGRLE